MSATDQPRSGSDRPEPNTGLPGGIAPPAVVLTLSLGLFVFAYLFPGVIQLGPNIHPGGIGVLGAAASAFWLLWAIAKRPPPS